jgi:hypothetical protein
VRRRASSSSDTTVKGNNCDEPKGCGDDLTPFTQLVPELHKHAIHTVTRVSGPPPEEEPDTTRRPRLTTCARDTLHTLVGKPDDFLVRRPSLTSEPVLQDGPDICEAPVQDHISLSDNRQSLDPFSDRYAVLASPIVSTVAEVAAETLEQEITADSISYADNYRMLTGSMPLTPVTPETSDGAAYFYPTQVADQDGKGVMWYFEGGDLRRNSASTRAAVSVRDSVGASTIDVNLSSPLRTMIRAMRERTSYDPRNISFESSYEGSVAGSGQE